MTENQKSDMNPLGLEPFQGCAVTGVGVTVSNAGGGLHDPLEIDPEMIESVAKISIGDSVYLLVRADCNGVSYKPVKGNEDQVRYVPSFHATDTTFVEDEWAVKVINEQRDRIERLREQAQGKQRLFDDANGLTSLSLVGEPEGGNQGDDESAAK